MIMMLLYCIQGCCVLKVDVDGKTQGVVVGVVKAEVKMEVDEEEEDLPLVCSLSATYSL